MADRVQIVTWPLVDPNDDGIRPAGRKDQCLYCQSRVGEPHGRECVMVTKRIRMKVRATLPGGPACGVWEFDEPHFWDEHLTEFHKNESSWCAGSFLAEEQRDSVEWEDGPKVWERLRRCEADGSCLCNVLSFEFLRIVDDTPRRKLRESPNGGPAE